MAIPQPKPARINFTLTCEIHYLQCKLPKDCELKLEVTSGKSFKQFTNPTLYSTSTSHAFFDSNLSGLVSLKKLDSKFLQKKLKMRVFQSHNNQEIGNIILDISHIPLLKKPISKKEIVLNSCMDKTALICVSISLCAVSENFLLLGPTKSLKKEVKVNKGNEFEMESCERDSDSESVASKMSFSEFIVNPKDSEQRSESSDEECKQLQAERLIEPKVNMESVTPNESSKSYMISELEAKNGINPSRQIGNCINCLVF